ncbi:hypothetical protein [Bergeyella zoohelcum]|uniref:hypothetical protein n=1 Tax=Bergeyella zoohelcum TaxID=1015 RepID=UPI003735F0EF
MKSSLILLLTATSMMAQEQKTDKVAELQRQVYQQKQEVATLKSKLKEQENSIYQAKKDFEFQTQNSKKQIDSLQNLVKTNSQNIETMATDLGTKIQQTENSTKESITKIDQNVNQNRMFWLGGLLATIGLGGLIYWLLGRKIKTSQTDVESQIKKTQKHLEEEAIKLDNKLVEVLESQLKLKQEEKAQLSTPVSNVEIDHSLALKVADEIIRIQKNISQMDSNTKGLKQLTASVKRIQDNFASNGYELVEMLGKEYNEGMKVVANFVPNEDLEKGQQIITRIIKPQVNYKGEMIQSAQIEVSIGE